MGDGCDVEILLPLENIFQTRLVSKVLEGSPIFPTRWRRRKY